MDPSSTQQKAWTPDATNYFWSATDTASDTEIVNSNTALTADFNALFAQQSVLPQQVTDDMVLEIKYGITIKYNGTTMLAETNIPASIQMNTLKNGSGVAIADWLPNKIYTYSITINPLTDQILIDPAIDANWATENVTATIE